MPRRTAHQLLSPPPLRGRVRVGGIWLWPTNVPAHYDVNSRMQSGSFGRFFGNGNWTDSNSDGKSPLAPTSSISSAWNDASSLKWTGASMPLELSKTPRAPLGCKLKTSGSFASGTMRCSKTLRASAKRLAELLGHPARANRSSHIALLPPPHPSPARGEGVYVSESVLHAQAH